jgi:hypothetical protein
MTIFTEEQTARTINAPRLAGVVAVIANGGKHALSVPERMTIRPSHAGAGGGFARCSAIAAKSPWNICRGIAASALWTATVRP